ncbi:MAG: tetratricopeptide repeat protein [Bacteroidales bacterium]|nr:tetratricopeptide repeat protein [Bacteroidales bacterium]
MKKKLLTGELKIYRYSALLVVVIPLVLYLSALRLGFVYFDDDILILDNYEKISDLSNIGRAFRTDAFFANLSPYYRPLMNVSFMADAAIGGKFPMMYHLSNLIYHLLTCLSLFWLLSLMEFSKPKALTGTLIFSVHPMIGHAILWIPARGDLLVTLFVIMTFALFIKYLNENKVKYHVLHVLCFAGAIFSKESAVFIPVLLFFWLLIKKEKLVNRKMLTLYGSWLLVLFLWYYLRSITIGQHDDSQQGVVAVGRNFSFLPEAVSRFFFPFMLPVTPVFSIGYTFSGVLIMGIITYFIIRMKPRKMLPVILFGTAWFVGFCMPNMFVRLVSANDSFEYLLHRTYLPYVGFLIMLLSVCPERWVDLKVKSNSIFLGILFLILCFTSVVQQKKYRNAVSYWGSAIQYAPDKAWFHYYMGRYYFKQKDYARFEKYLLTADSLKSYPEFKYHLGMVAFLEKKNLERAYEYFTEAFKQGYGSTEARANFIALCIESSSDFFQKGSYSKAITRVEEALINDPSNGVAAYNLGIYLVNNGEKQRAASMWHRAIRLKPDLTEAYRSLFYYYHFDAKKADSAAWFAREYTKHGGAGNLISPEQ